MKLTALKWCLTLDLRARLVSLFLPHLPPLVAWVQVQLSQHVDIGFSVSTSFPVVYSQYCSKLFPSVSENLYLQVSTSYFSLASLHCSEHHLRVSSPKKRKIIMKIKFNKLIPHFFEGMQFAGTRFIFSSICHQPGFVLVL